MGLYEEYLISAITHGQIKHSLHWLKKPEIDINRKDRFGNTPLILASDKGYIEIVKELLLYPGIKVNEQNFNKDTALIKATENKHIEIINELIKISETNIFIMNCWKHSALMLSKFRENKIREIFDQRMTIDLLPILRPLSYDIIRHIVENFI